jgi:prevent-host-death family protein
MTTVVTNLTNDAGDTWTVANAKAQSEVLDRAATRGPQVITPNGRPAALVVGPQEWTRKTRRAGSLADFFAASPLREAPDLVVARQDAPDVTPACLLVQGGEAPESASSC